MVCKKDKCTGCFACYNICPKNAIEMIVDDYGYLYPKVNKEKCVNCKMCEKVCPSINMPIFRKPVKVFAMAAKNEEVRLQSSSGGAATVFAENIIKNNGIVYGCAYSKGCHIQHIRINKIEDLDKLKGSKYVHSYVLDTFRQVKKDLNEGLTVLYIGTPCKIAGLRNYVKKCNNDKLYLVDLVCHGVPSQKYLSDSLYDKNEDNVIFRVKNNFVLKETNEDGFVLKETSAEDSFYYRAFFEALTYRENCYTCNYAKSDRCSDLTIGDFWGLGEDSKFYKDKEKGVSVLLVNTEKGKKLIEIASKEILIEERSLEEAKKKNGQLNRPKEINKNYYKFQKLYIKYGFNKAYRKINKYRLFKNRLKKNKLINNLYKKIIRRG